VNDDLAHARSGFEALNGHVFSPDKGRRFLSALVRYAPLRYLHRTSA
jgi:hypothetical protein